MMHLRSVIGITLVAGLALASASSAQDTMKHSGSVVSVDEQKGTLVMHEVGPWQLRDGQTVLTTLTIAVTPGTAFKMASRGPAEIPGSLGPFVVTPIAAWAVFAGDFVTVDCRHEGKRLIATAITVSEVPAE